MKSVMFVCTGNICRSAMAEYYMQDKVKKLGKENEYMISSCGTHARSGEASTQTAIKIMQERYNIDMTHHRAKELKDVNIKDYDLVLCMTWMHEVEICRVYSKMKNKVHLLKEFVGIKDKYTDIDDPWGYDENVYNRVLDEIFESVDKLLEIY